MKRFGRAEAIVPGVIVTDKLRSYRVPLQKFVSIHSSIHNHFNLERHLYNRKSFKLNRDEALAEWRQLAA